MRILVLVTMLACERATPAPPAPIESEPAPPGPRRLETPVDAAPVDATVATTTALREVLAVLADRGRVDPVRQQSAFAPDPRWSAARITITEFRQRGRAIEVEGDAPSVDEVVELAKRLGVDPVFNDVAIARREQRGSAVRFTIEMQAPAEDPATALVIRP